MEYFGRCQYQPLSLSNKYNICLGCFYFIPNHAYLHEDQMCQSCNLKKNKYYVTRILQRASNAPGLTHIFHRIMFVYL